MRNTQLTPPSESGELSSTELDSRLESLYRENLRISETVQAHIEGASLEEMNLLDSINILAGLRDASEEASRNSFMFNKSRNATLKRKAGVVEDGEEGSAAPSPRPGNGGRDRLAVEKKEKRGGSVPSTREVSVKIEDGAESVTSSVDGSKREFSGFLFLHSWLAFVSLFILFLSLIVSPWIYSFLAPFRLLHYAQTLCLRVYFSAFAFNIATTNLIFLFITFHTHTSSTLSPYQFFTKKK